MGVSVGGGAVVGADVLVGKGMLVAAGAPSWQDERSIPTIRIIMVRCNIKSFFISTLLICW
jgi:hypothetical protein